MPLGLEDKRLTPGSLTASTYYNHHLSPWHGRLNHRWSWSARTRNNRQWFKVNFGYVTRFKGIATQGRQDANQWVKTYIVTYSRDGVSYVPYKENRRVKVRVLLIKGAFVWDQSGIRIIGIMRVSVCLGAILIPEYLDSHSGYSAPRSRTARIYSGIYSYSGISQTNAP